MRQRRIGQHASTISSVSRSALGRFSRDLHRMHDAAEADVGPDDRRLRVPLEQLLHLRQVDRLRRPASANGMSMSLCRITTSRPRRRSRGSDRAPGWSGSPSRPRSSPRRTPCGCVNSPMPREHARERRQHAPDVIGGVHVGRVEAGDHRIEARLLLPAAASGRRIAMKASVNE